MNKVLLICSFLLVLAGCSQTDSENIRTQGIGADFSVTANGNGSTRVEGTLEVGSGGIGGTEVELSSGDQLTANAYGTTLNLRKDSNLLGISYVTTFNSDEGNELFTVSFERDGGVSAPNSTVILPNRFAIIAPADNEPFGRTENITLTWAPAEQSGNLTIRYTADCSYTDDLGEDHFVTRQGNDSSLDDGSYTISAASIINSAVNEIPVDGTCDVEFELQRVRTGNLDSNFGEGGRIRAYQNRSINIVVVP